MSLSTLADLAVLFLRLGATAFGGPAAHIALMEREFVTQRRWLSAQEFLDLMGAANLIPGPTSTELALHIGHKRAGLPGLCVAGVCFIFPAALMVLGLAIFYQRFGELPQTRWLLTGVQPVVVAIVAHALWKLLGTAIKDVFTAIIAAGVLLLALLGVNEIALIFGAAVIGLCKPPRNARTEPLSQDEEATPPADTSAKCVALLGSGVLLPASLWQVFFVFFKIGAFVYGSGYVLLAFLQTELVEKLQWISSRQLLDAVAIGQITPGPLFTSATFIGYLVQGIPGAVMATIGIFLPAFLFSAVVSANWKRLTGAPRARFFLDAVNAASVVLMLLVTLQLGRVALDDAGVLFALLAFSITLLALIKTRINSLWLMLSGALVGYLIHAL